MTPAVPDVGPPSTTHLESAIDESVEARRIPETVLRKKVDGLNALRLHISPIHPEDTRIGSSDCELAVC